MVWRSQVHLNIYTHCKHIADCHSCHNAEGNYSQCSCRCLLGLQPQGRCKQWPTDAHDVMITFLSLEEISD